MGKAIEKIPKYRTQTVCLHTKLFQNMSFLLTTRLTRVHDQKKDYTLYIGK